MSKMTPSSEKAPAGGEGPLDQFLCFSVYAAGLSFNRVYKPLLAKYDITYPQYLALIAIGARADQTVSELGNQLYLESNTLTPLIKRLEEAGLVTRTRDGKDERVVRVNLTSKGEGVLRDASSCVPKAIFEATGLTPASLEALNEQIRKLGSNLRDHKSE
jgi:MarR family transcriptional regulator, organic hydroperoxide resistance regulator